MGSCTCHSEGVPTVDPSIRQEYKTGVQTGFGKCSPGRVGRAAVSLKAERKQVRKERVCFT